MSRFIKCIDKHIEITPPESTKKITGTRFASVLGKNRWSTPFEMWCAITRTYEAPFEGNMYTKAGSTIEPKQAAYIEKTLGTSIVKPSDIYGDISLEDIKGDFFSSESKILGGMWDYLGKDENGNVDTVFEMKTTKRRDDWATDIPEHYALQGALYAYLKGVDNVTMVCSFLKDTDYERPTDFEPTADNTIIKTFKVSERYPNFSELVTYAKDWWYSYVEKGISPNYNVVRDAKILKEIRRIYGI